MKLKNKYNLAIDNEIIQANAHPQKEILIVDDNFIQFKNFKMDVQFNWIAIQSVRFIQNNLFFYIADNLPFLIISEEEIGEENFLKLKNIVTNKNLIQK